MQIIPEWAPNVHPMFVHFPIALLILAVFVDLLSVILKKHLWIRYSALMLYGAGALTTLIAYLSGQEAADVVQLPREAIPVLSEHADLAFMVLLFFAVFTLIRGYTIWKAGKQYQLISIILLALTLPGLYLIFETSEHGAELVFKYGIGVKHAEASDLQEGAGSRMNKSGELPGIKDYDDGSWQWNPLSDAETVLKQKFQWLQGNIDSIQIGLINTQPAGHYLKLKLAQNKIFITRGQKLKNIAADLYLNSIEFEGKLRLAHHVQDKRNYDFAELDKNEIKLGRLTDNNIQIFEDKSVSYQGPIKLSVVSDGGHFRGYIDDELYAHGHGSEPLPGTVGIMIEGKGKLVIDKLNVKSLIQ